MTQTLLETLTTQFETAFEKAGFDRDLGQVVVSNRRDIGQFQCNGAMPGAKRHGKAPRDIAQAVLDNLEQKGIFTKLELAGPGFINITLTDDFLAKFTSSLINDPRQGLIKKENPTKVVVDYGGPNVAKEMHIGHLRTAIIGEAVKRLYRFAGDEVIGDVHLGDWGTQMGMLIEAVRKKDDSLPYFDENYTGDYPKESPVTVADLGKLYPEASSLCKEDETEAEKARQATAELQNGRRGYRALWQHFVNVSISALKRDYADIGVEFDLWNGEASAHPFIEPSLEKIQEAGLSYKDNGALIADITPPEGKEECAPIILRKADGAVLYGTTDVATIYERVEHMKTEKMIYVVDHRQSFHFYQVFDIAKRSGIAPNAEFKHVGYGTVNGEDGKPFKTRSGGTMRLRDLIDMAQKAALARMEESNIGMFDNEVEKKDIANKVGIAAIKFADLMNNPTSSYIFDLDKFSQFEGKTGPYILYTGVRIKSVLRKAKSESLKAGDLIAPTTDAERELMLLLTKLPREMKAAYDQYAPNYLCEFMYDLCGAYGKFYNDCHIMNETDIHKQASWIRLCEMTLTQIELISSIIGLDIPERM